MQCGGRFLTKAWSGANGKIAARKDGFGRRPGFDLIHAEWLLDDCGKADHLRFRLSDEGRTVRQGQGEYAST